MKGSVDNHGHQKLTQTRQKNVSALETAKPQRHPPPPSPHKERARQRLETAHRRSPHTDMGSSAVQLLANATPEHLSVTAAHDSSAARKGDTSAPHAARP